MTKFPLGKCHILLLNPEKELKTDQTTDAVEVQCVEPVCLIRVTSRNRGEGLFIEAEMTQTATSLKPAPAWVTICQTGKSEDHCTA